MKAYSVKSAQAVEVHISAVPAVKASAQEQGEELFSGIREVLQENNARILQERVFCVASVAENISVIRSKIYGELDDGVEPSWLGVSEGMFGQVPGVQVHAVSCDSTVQIVQFAGQPCGRIIELGSLKYMTLSGISAPDAGQSTEQAREMLENGEFLLKQAGGNMFSVARTWMWLADILSWYEDFNYVRNQFFKEYGLIRKDVQPSIPASTGIGIGPAGGARCAMELVAAIEPAGAIVYLNEDSFQHSAFEYGSSFSRATRVPTPAGEAVYVSGTASINASGATVHIGDIQAQIDVTIENVRAVLKDMNCRDEDVVQAMAYCKTDEVEEVFCQSREDLPWPCLVLLTDICREDLLFEVEVMAVLRK